MSHLLVCMQGQRPLPSVLQHQTSSVLTGGAAFIAVAPNVAAVGAAHKLVCSSSRDGRVR